MGNRYVKKGDESMLKEMSDEKHSIPSIISELIKKEFERRKREWGEDAERKKREEEISNLLKALVCYCREENNFNPNNINWVKEIKDTTSDYYTFFFSEILSKDNINDVWVYGEIEALWRRRYKNIALAKIKMEFEKSKRRLGRA